MSVGVYMNNRIAKKILLQASTLSTDIHKVLQAREHLRNNREYFKRKRIYLLSTAIDEYI